MVWAFAKLIVTHSHAVLNQQKSFYCICLHISTGNLIEDEKSAYLLFQIPWEFKLAFSIFFLSTASSLVCIYSGR